MLRASIRIAFTLMLACSAVSAQAQSPAPTPVLPAGVKLVVLGGHPAKGTHDPAHPRDPSPSKGMQERPRALTLHHRENLMRSGGGQLPAMQTRSAKAHPRLTVAAPDANDWGWLAFSRPQYVDARRNFVQLNNSSVIYRFHPRASGSRYLLDFEIQANERVREFIVSGLGHSAQSFSVDPGRQHLLVLFDVTNTNEQTVSLSSKIAHSWDFFGCEVTVLEASN